MKNLREHLTFDQARMVVEDANEGKDLYMKGICIQGGVRNANQRVYPVNEIGRAVKTLNDQIAGGYSVLGEVDHPEGLNINLDRVSHMITEMWMDDANGYGKLKILGKGEIKNKINLSVNFVSKQAKEKIEKIGGKLTLIKN